MFPFDAKKKLRKLSERFIDNSTSIEKDALLVLEHLWTLPYLFSPFNSEASTKSELHWKSYNNLFDYVSAGIQAVLPLERKAYSTGTIACNPEHFTHSGESEKWFFINGIATSPPVAILNCRELARVFHRSVHLIHTPTFGAVWDIVDSITARTLRKDGVLSRPAYDLVKEALVTHDKVVLVGHSQGTIVASYIARKLLKDKKYRHLAPKLEIYCIAGVADSFRVDKELSEEFKRGVPYVEHFVNTLDFFGRIGVLSHLDHTAGAVFSTERKGHLLNDHYIPALERGEYCDQQSRLFKYVDGHSPSDTDFVHHIY
ncbi:hypothetical protein A9Q81_01950 [Gammaproteobacteria bacterium 42_54_T18]|nr:hypothetical protein A9Q81_01950 [Gammaproteobacteria bacterium 42_54_T18]